MKANQVENYNELVKTVFEIDRTANAHFNQTMREYEKANSISMNIKSLVSEPSIMSKPAPILFEKTT